MIEEDDEIIWKGSPLHKHLEGQGIDDDETFEETAASSDTISKADNGQTDEQTVDLPKDDDQSAVEIDEAVLLRSARSFMWPAEDQLLLEVNVAKAILESELLVQEDDEFLHNFILNEETLAEYERLMTERPSRMSSYVSDMVLFSGSVAAVAGAVLYLSGIYIIHQHFRYYRFWLNPVFNAFLERARAATAAAAILPTAIAAMTSVRIGTKVQQDQQSEHFHKVIELLLNDMKTFKQLVRKSLNLLQGMEMISGGNYLTVDPSTGASSAVTTQQSGASRPNETTNSKDTKLVKALGGRTTFPALRQAAFKCTVQIIEAYRDAVSKLMEVSPLADHVDLKEHYIAFVSLENFGIHPDRPLESQNEITVQELKETAQVALVQQSEYLRRFSLAFCEKVREDNEINKAGVLKHIRDLFTTIRQINNRLSRVLEYHQAMGLDIEALEQKGKNALALSHKSSSHRRATHVSPHKFVPLRSIYTSMFSTGLHLQHSLLKLRKLEKLFDTLDKRAKRTHHSSGGGRTSPQIPIDETQLVEWLRGFQEIQAELNACVGCLEEGVSQIDTLQGNNNKPTTTNTTKDGENTATAASDFETLGATASATHDSCGQSEDDLFDEVFEAFIDGREAGIDYLNQLDEDAQQSNEMTKQSNQVLRELKRVLVYKAREHEIREAQALSRQRGEPVENPLYHPTDPFGFPIGQASGNFPWVNSSNFDDSFIEPQHQNGTSNGNAIDDFDEDESSSSSSCPTVRSVSPTKIGNISKDESISVSSTIPRSISGQLLDSDPDESSLTESCSRLYSWQNSEIDLQTLSNHDLVSMADSRTMSLISLDEEFEEKPNLRALSNVRSISSPDLKNLEINSDTTARSYRTLRAVPNGKSIENGSDDGGGGSSGSSGSGWGSADDLEVNVLKTYHRPLRPAAIVPKTRPVTTQKSVEKKKRSLRQKRDRNRSNISDIQFVVNDSLPPVTSNDTSSYSKKHESEDNPLSQPRQHLTGFQASMAMEAARAALSMKNGNSCQEEFIGGASGSDDSD